MPVDKPSSARAVACEVLNRFDPKRDYASSILNKLLHKTSERQRATDLVFGTLRNRTAIDVVITKFTTRPTERIQAKVLNIVRIGAYELIFSPATPDYSIVNEAVENTKAVAGKRQVGFVNAALRQIARHISNRQSKLSQSNVCRMLPQTLTTGCEFDTEILPEPKVSPAEYLSAAFSIPKWLVEDWLGEYGVEDSQQICFASNRRPSIYIRPNILKTKTDEIADKFRQADIGFEIVPLDTPRASSIEHQESRMLKIKSPKVVTDLPGFSDGWFTIQDISAAQPVRILNAQPGWRILDLCAAPGTKTTQLAEATGDKAEIIATDIDAGRLKMLEENVTRLGLKSIKIIEYEQLFQKSEIENRKLKFTIDSVDCVLLDVPCSNTGVFAKRIEARYRITPDAVKAIAKTQAELLKTAALMLKPDGKICYSTCSIQKRENREVVAEFLEGNPEFKLESERLILPSAESPADHDGGYTAVIVRK